jgi:hypothetical protein
MAGLEFSYTFDPGDTAKDMVRDAHGMMCELGVDSTLGAGSALGPEPGDGDRGGGGGPGADDGASGDAARAAALRLLEQMQDNVAELAAVAPELVPLAIDQLEASGVKPAPAIAAMTGDHRFYWLRIPYTLQPKADYRFDRLEISIEINPGAGALQRPRILSALPAREFVTLASATTELSIGIDEGLQFSMAAGKVPEGHAAADHAAGTAGAHGNTAGAHVAVHGAGKLGFVAGPFNYRLRKAVIERGTLPSERVFWRISESETLTEAPPELIAVIAVPGDTAQLQIAAALQAYASGAILTMTLGGFLTYLGSKLRQFFASGAPVRSTRVWDLTPRLARHT